jgi:antirestriction protein ArdC
VQKGEKATPVYFYKPIEVEDKSADTDHDIRRIPILRTFSVFHASQLDGIPEFGPPVMTKTVPERIEDVDTIVQASGVPVRIGGDRAFYSPASDSIQMPPDAAFTSPAERAATVLHELGHASGAKHRLNRDLSGKFGSSAYAREELRVEISSVLVGGAIGLPSDIPNHASYFSSWLEILKSDRREIFHASAEAQRIADYILGFHPDYAVRPDESAEGADGASPVAVPLAA